MKKTEKIWHCPVRAFCEHRTKLGAWLHFLFSGTFFNSPHARPYLYEEVDFNKCSYCGTRKNLEFSWMEGAICENCSEQWHKDHPRALSKVETLTLTSMLSENIKSKTKRPN